MGKPREPTTEYKNKNNLEVTVVTSVSLLAEKSK